MPFIQELFETTKSQTSIENLGLRIEGNIHDTRKLISDYYPAFTGTVVGLNLDDLSRSVEVSSYKHDSGFDSFIIQLQKEIQELILDPQVVITIQITPQVVICIEMLDKTKFPYKLEISSPSLGIEDLKDMTCHKTLQEILSQKTANILGFKILILISDVSSSSTFPTAAPTSVTTKVHLKSASQVESKFTKVPAESLSKEDRKLDEELQRQMEETAKYFEEAKHSKAPIAPDQTYDIVDPDPLDEMRQQRQSAEQSKAMDDVRAQLAEAINKITSEDSSDNDTASAQDDLHAFIGVPDSNVPPPPEIASEVTRELQEDPFTKVEDDE